MFGATPRSWQTPKGDSRAPRVFPQSRRGSAGARGCGSGAAPRGRAGGGERGWGWVAAHESLLPPAARGSHHGTFTTQFSIKFQSKVRSAFPVSPRSRVDPASTRTRGELRDGREETLTRFDALHLAPHLFLLNLLSLPLLLSCTPHSGVSCFSLPVQYPPEPWKSLPPAELYLGTRAQQGSAYTLHS